MPLAQRNPELAKKIEQMRLDIAPIVHVCTGVPPDDFPTSMLQLYLLTEPQLDAFAHYYSQVSPASSNPTWPDLKYAYPQTMDWTKPFLHDDPTLPDNCKLTDTERLKIKMRMFARFIGMRGAETPRWEYERQFEILRNKIERSVRDEEISRSKFYWGPNARMF
ncbi:hypothetical protein DM02DRAFT_511155 [Periconia macrospinosa]|uniref:Uncharacterized protein n=1 Tax=Periconia macrospinosa TaxID=97972 RepID=A0A2V1EDT3_9PLEO|nr:hypothetical protein DM02DRAFT_511155 [Periconia macrospinosa]